MINKNYMAVVYTFIAFFLIDAVLASFYESLLMSGTEDIAYHHARDYSHLLSGVIWAAFILLIIDYKYLLLQWLAFIYFLTEVVDVIQFNIPEKYVPMVTGISIGVFGLWVVYTVCRRDSLDDDVLTDRHVYTIATRPDGPQSFFVSLRGDPYGKYVHYVRGTVYYYNKTFKKMPIEKFPMAGKTIIKTDVEVTSKVIGKLNMMDKEKWNGWRNCLTVVFRLRNA